MGQQTSEKGKTYFYEQMLGCSFIMTGKAKNHLPYLCICNICRLLRDSHHIQHRFYSFIHRIKYGLNDVNIVYFLLRKVRVFSTKVIHSLYQLKKFVYLIIYLITSNYVNELFETNESKYLILEQLYT